MLWGLILSFTQHVLNQITDSTVRVPDTDSGIAGIKVRRAFKVQARMV